MSHKIRLYLYGLISAAVSSVAGGIGSIVVDHTTYNLGTPAGRRALLVACGALAIAGFSAYYKTHPPPKLSDPDFVPQAQAIISKVVAQTNKPGGAGPEAAGLKLE